MADDEARCPLLEYSRGRAEAAGPNHQDDAQESTPLFARSDSTPRYDGSHDGERIVSPAATSLRSLQSGWDNESNKRKRRWPTIAAVLTLGTLAIIIMVAAFVTPITIEQYAKEALVVEPTSISIHSFNSHGVIARIQADFRLDASRVSNNDIRNIGRAGTWLAQKVESKESVVKVYLPEYGNLLLGTATVPAVVVSIRDGETTPLDFLADLRPGKVEGFRNVINDWLDGKLGDIWVAGKASVPMKSGLFSLGTKEIAYSMNLKGDDVPAIPSYNISRINFHEVQLPSGRSGMAADVSLAVQNNFPIKLSIPPLGFDILVPNCRADEPYLALADATTDTINIEPKTVVHVDVGGVVRRLPEAVTAACPNSHSSPLDLLLGSYIHGKDATLYVRGSNAPSSETPEWITQIMSSVTVPIPFPGHTFDGAIRKFNLTDVHFGLPDPYAAPDTPGSMPKVSGNIKVLAALPKEMNFGINVSKVRAIADVFYKGQKFGFLDLKKWQTATSSRVEDIDSDKNAGLQIESLIRDAPLNVTNDDLFGDLVQKLIFGHDKHIDLHIKALVDVQLDTVLGDLIVRDLPGEGVVPVKAPMDGGFEQLSPKIGDLQITSTTSTSLLLQANVNFTNPTPYTAHIPYANIHILNNGSLLGHATIRNITVGQGINSNVVATAVWDPSSLGGTKSATIGRELLSQYISGWNTTLTFRTHNGSIPTQPALGRALSRFNFTIPTPRLNPVSDGNDNDNDDDDDDDDGGSDSHRKSPRFIKEATFHLFSSSATFILISPLQHSTLYVERINATALYHHTEPIGSILHELPFKVPPGASLTPKLPVDWSLGSVGYEKLRQALGGTLKLDAVATVRIRLDHWSEEVWYVGGGIGAHVRI